MSKGPKFVTVISGKLKADKIVPAVLETSKEDNVVAGGVGGVKIASKNNVVMGQVTDGTLIIASDKALFESAAKGGSRAAKKAVWISTRAPALSPTEQPSRLPQQVCVVSDP